MTEPISYSHRPRPVGPQITYRLEARGLGVDNGRKVELIPYARIAQARLAYRPSSFLWDGYCAKLTLTDGRTLHLTNYSFAGQVQVERHDEAYRAFIKALLASIEQANPRLLCLAGRAAPVWALTSLAGVLMLTGLLASTIAALRQNSWSAAVLSAAMLASFGILTIRMIARNRPQVFKPPFPPDAVMPAKKTKAPI